MKPVRCLLVAAFAISLSQSAIAGLNFGWLKGGGCGEPGAESCAPVTCVGCKPEYVKEKYTKSCYKADTKKVCIPAIKFPWMKCGEFGCPKVKCVSVFKKEEIECERYVVKWSLDDPDGKCCKEGCGKAGCTGGCTTRGGCTNGVAPCAMGGCAPVRGGVSCGQ